MAKPGDFFVGVTDLFSVLLPGAMAAFLLMKAEESAGWDLLGLLKLTDIRGYAAFFVCTYLLGNVADLIGAMVLDGLYDLFYAGRMRCKDPFFRWLAGLPREAFSRARDWNVRLFRKLETVSPEPDDTLFLAAKRLAPHLPKGDRLYQWCRDWIQVNSPAAIQEIDRLQANSKFFRSLIVVVAMFALLVLLPTGFREKNIKELAGALLLIGSATLAFFAFLRFSDLRWKAVHHAYRIYIVLQRSKPPSIS